MNIDLKTLALIVSLLGIVAGGAMGYGSLKTEVSTLKTQINMRTSGDQKVASDIMEMKTNIATLLERTKP